MEDKMKPGKPAKEVTAGLRRSQAVSGGNNDPGRPAPVKKMAGSNRGRSGVEGRK